MNLVVNVNVNVNVKMNAVVEDCRGEWRTRADRTVLKACDLHNLKTEGNHVAQDVAT